MRFPAEPNMPSGAVPECQIHPRCIFCPPSCKIRGRKKTVEAAEKGLSLLFVLFDRDWAQGA